MLYERCFPVPDGLRRTSDTSSGEFGEEDHAIDVVVLCLVLTTAVSRFPRSLTQKLYIRAHFCHLKLLVKRHSFPARINLTLVTCTMTTSSISGNLFSKNRQCVRDILKVLRPKAGSCVVRSGCFDNISVKDCIFERKASSAVS